MIFLCREISWMFRKPNVKTEDHATEGEFLHHSFLDGFRPMLQHRAVGIAATNHATASFVLQIRLSCEEKNSRRSVEDEPTSVGLFFRWGRGQRMKNEEVDGSAVAAGYVGWGESY